MVSSNLVRRRTSTHIASAAEVLSPVALQFASPTEDSIRTHTKAYTYYGGMTTSDGTSRTSWPHKVLFTGGVLLTMLPWAFHLSTVFQGHALQRTIADVSSEYRILQQKFGTRKKELQKVMAETDALQASNDKLLAQLKIAGDTFEEFDNAAYVESEQMEKGLLQRITDVEREISRASERNLKEKGYLFHRNSVEIRIQGIGTWDKHLVIELASTTLVPHVVETFISFVESNYYDGWSLISRGFANEQTLEAVRREPQGLSVVSASNSDMVNQLAVLQHNDYELSNTKYSVVFKDHGPFFYINMAGSTVSHNHNDVVIGTIVQGREILDFMLQTHFFIPVETMVLQSVDPIAQSRAGFTNANSAKSSSNKDEQMRKAAASSN